jgi:hypothetical protein
MLDATIQWRRAEKPDLYDPEYISPEVSFQNILGKIWVYDIPTDQELRRNYRGSGHARLNLLHTHHIFQLG